MAKAKKLKRINPDSDREEEEEDLVEKSEKEAERQAIERPTKKQKKAEPEPEPEAEEDQEEDAGTDEERLKKKMRHRREHKRVSGYRLKAKECGFDRKAGVIAASGIDSFASCLSPADAKRLMRFVPEVLNKCSYDKSECAERMALSTESVPGSAARETQARCEAVLRHIANEAVLRTAESNKMRVDAATVHSVIRRYAHSMTFTAILPPKGLIRHAQSRGKLTAVQADEEAQAGEASENKELTAAAKKIEKAEADRKAAFQKRKADLAATRVAAVAAA